MVLNSIGVYGFLNRAHLEHALAGDVTVSSKAAAVGARLDAKAADLDDIKARIAQLDQTRTVATKGRTKPTTVGDQGPARARLEEPRADALAGISDLKIEVAKVDGERKAVEADLGPVRHLGRPCARPTTPPCVISSWWWRSRSTRRPSCCFWPRRMGALIDYETKPR